VGRGGGVILAGRFWTWICEGSDNVTAFGFYLPSNLYCQQLASLHSMQGLLVKLNYMVFQHNSQESLLPMIIPLVEWSRGTSIDVERARATGEAATVGAHLGRGPLSLGGLANQKLPSPAPKNCDPAIAKDSLLRVLLLFQLFVTLWRLFNHIPLSKIQFLQRSHYRSNLFRRTFSFAASTDILQLPTQIA